MWQLKNGLLLIAATFIGASCGGASAVPTAPDAVSDPVRAPALPHRSCSHRRQLCRWFRRMFTGMRGSAPAR